MIKSAYVYCAHFGTWFGNNAVYVVVKKKLIKWSFKNSKAKLWLYPLLVKVNDKYQTVKGNRIYFKN